MGQNPGETVSEIEETREELARKVDELVDRARAEAGQVGRKVAIGAAAVGALLVLGWIAKRRVGT
jgi:hypothetical protein